MERSRPVVRVSGEAKLLLVANPGVKHVGAHFRNAAQKLGLEVRFCDLSAAYLGPRWRVKINWWLRGRRPARLKSFSAEVVDACREFRPRSMLATGVAPLSAGALESIGKLGVERLNFLTDDPWNPVHRAPWFFEALPRYDHVFTPRRANQDDLQRLGCSRVSYLPFAYAPEIHFPEPELSRARQQAVGMVFIGNADPDRFPPILALLDAGIPVVLYGDYWERDRRTRPHARGFLDPQGLRRVLGAAKVTLGLVRRANRDGHAMRSFEFPAMGACMLTEATAEHREIFGEEGKHVMYFDSIPEMVQKTRWLLEHDEDRCRLAAAAHALITQGRNSYQDRLETLLGLQPPMHADQRR